MGKTGATGLTRIRNAFKYSLLGIRAAIRSEAAFRQELIGFAILLPGAFLLGRNSIDYLFLVGSLLLVLIVELLNSAVEAVVDHVSPEFAELAGRAKDMGSAAVFIALVNAVLVWAVVAYSRFV